VYKITAPNQEYTGEVGGVLFEKGKAETENLLVVDYCRNAGYKVEEIKTPPEEKKKPAKKGSV